MKPGDLTPWGQPQPETFAYHCPGCGEAATLEVRDRWDMISGDGDDWDPFQYTTARCLTCRMPFVFTAEADFNRGGYLGRVQEYPKSDRQLPVSVPHDVRDAYREAQQCLSASAPTAAAIMARRVVEAIRKREGYPKGTLAAALQKMKDDGQLDPRLHDWASVVRDVGNEGAHDTEKAVSPDDAAEALFFAEALIDYFYVFRDRHEAFKRRREAVKEGRDPYALETFTFGGSGATSAQGQVTEQGVVEESAPAE